MLQLKPKVLQLNPKYLSRYKDVARMLIKYGRTDLVSETKLDEHVGEGEAESQDPSLEFSQDIEKLGATAIKLGQLLSTRSDLLPQKFIQSLSRLQDNVEAFSFEEVEKIIESELGVKCSQLFEHLEEKPLAAASLGQVHRGILRSGKEVVVKVQRPNVEEQVEADLQALGDIAQFFDSHTSVGKRYEFSRIVKSLQESLERELDYRKEKDHLNVMKENLKGFSSIVVPSPYDQLCSKRVLTMEYVAGNNITSLSPVVFLELDGAKLARELFNAYLHQVLVCGFFHADPHPGNILVTQDGRLGILDLGMVASIPSSERNDLFRLLLAISEGSAKRASEAAIHLGRTSEEFDRRQFEEDVNSLLLEHQAQSVGDLKAGRIVLDIQKVSTSNGLHLSTGITMLGKTLLNLDKVVAVLDPTFNPREAIRERAPIVLAEQAKSLVSRDTLFQTVVQSSDFLEQLPRRVDSILHNLAENQLRIDVDGVDEKKMMQAFQKVANRITCGLLLSAMMVGASLIMDIETRHTLFGYPVLAIVLFLVSIVGALYLIVQSLLRDD